MGKNPASYKFEKRKKEIARQKKQEEKRQRQIEKKQEKPNDLPLISPMESLSLHLRKLILIFTSMTAMIHFYN